MRVRILSDLHLDYNIATLTVDFKEKADVCILAGDVAQLSNYNYIAETLDDICYEHKHVIWVPGNHEYYKGSIYDKPSDLPDEIIYLDRDTCIIDDVKFAGCTLWTSLADGVRLGQINKLNDFYMIKEFNEDTMEYHEQHLLDCAFLLNNQDADVIITHHAPFRNSISPEFEHSDTNVFYANDFKESPEACKLWVHGHTHRSMDYKKGNTRVVCNAYGYNKFYVENMSHNWDVIVEV